MIKGAIGLEFIDRELTFYGRKLEELFLILFIAYDSCEKRYINANNKVKLERSFTSRISL